MFEKFRFGSYRIDDSELANSKKNNLKLNSVLVTCLDGSKLTFQLDVSANVNFMWIPNIYGIILIVVFTEKS